MPWGGVCRSVCRAVCKALYQGCNEGGVTRGLEEVGLVKTFLSKVFCQKCWGRALGKKLLGEILSEMVGEMCGESIDLKYLLKALGRKIW